MPVASAISTHSIQSPHHPAAEGFGGRGQVHANGSGSESAPNFGEVLRGQAGVVAQPILSGATAKQAGQSGGKASGQTEEMAEVKAGGLVSQQAHGSAGQINEAMKAKAAAQVDWPSAQLQALSKVGAQSAEADNVQAATTGAAELKALEKVERDDHAKLSPPGADAGDGKAVKAKSGKGGKADEAGKAGKSIAEKPPQVPVQAAALATSAAAPVAAPVLPLLEKSVKAESVLPSRAANTTVPLAKSPSGRQVPQTKTAAAGKIQGLADSAALPMPNASSAPESAQAMAGDLTGDANSERLPGVKSSGKQDSSASAAKTGSEIVSQAKHLNSPLPTAVHSSQVAQALVTGPGEMAAHNPASPQNFAGVAGPALSAAHGASIGAASPYDRIDQGTAPVVLHAGAQQVAVGVHDPSLGWVEIKTQSAAGHVDATLVASSGQTRDALAAQLPAISQFLEQRDVRVGTLVVNHQSAGSGANHFGNGSGGGAGTHHAGQGYGGNGASGGNGGNNGSQRHAPRYNAPAPARHAVPVTGAGGESSSTARPLSYISVRA